MVMSAVFRFAARSGDRDAFGERGCGEPPVKHGKRKLALDGERQIAGVIGDELVACRQR